MTYVVECYNLTPSRFQRRMKTHILVTYGKRLFEFSRFHRRVRSPELTPTEVTAVCKTGHHISGGRYQLLGCCTYERVNARSSIECEQSPALAPAAAQEYSHVPGILKITPLGAFTFSRAGWIPRASSTGGQG